MANVAKDLAQLISQSKSNKTGPYDTQATVKRVEGNKVWVSIPGGVDETPIDKTVNCTAGDKVQVRVSGGRAWITGNASAPPTDDTTAIKARTTANEAQVLAVDAKETADAVEGIAVSASTTATTAKTIAEGVNEHFWHDSTGAHVTEVTQDEWNDPGDPNYHSGGNTLITTQGMAIRKGLNNLAEFGAGGIQFVNEYNLPILQSEFNAISNYNSKIDVFEYSNESPFTVELPWDIQSGYENALTFTFYTNKYPLGVVNSITTTGHWSVSDRIVTFDATLCTDMQTKSVAFVGVNYRATGKFPFYTLGKRVGVKGNFSTVIGENGKASGVTSVSLGDSCSATGSNALATGLYTCSTNTDTIAAGKGTIAAWAENIAIGRYNSYAGDITDNKPFVIGNGTADNARSNAFTVGWSGSVEAAGTITTGGHSSAIGDRQERNNSTTKSTGTSWTTVSTATVYADITAGTWLIQGTAVYENNSTGFRGLRLYNNTTSAVYARSEDVRAAVSVSGQTTSVHSLVTVTATGANTIVLQTFQNSGGTRSVDYWIEAIRIA